MTDEFDDLEDIVSQTTIRVNSKERNSTNTFQRSQAKSMKSIKINRSDSDVAKSKSHHRRSKSHKVLPKEPTKFLRNKIVVAQSNYLRTQKKNEPREESFGKQQAKLRPANYDKLSEGEKWDIDKALGILDWSGE